MQASVGTIEPRRRARFAARVSSRRARVGTVRGKNPERAYIGGVAVLQDARDRENVPGPAHKIRHGIVTRGSRTPLHRCYSRPVKMQSRVLLLVLSGFASSACTPPPAQKTRETRLASSADDDEPVRPPTRFDVGAMPAPTPVNDELACGPAQAGRNPAVALLSPQELEATLLTPTGFAVKEASDDAAATAPTPSPLVPTVRRMYQKGAGAPLSVELRDAARQCPLDAGEELARQHASQGEGLKTKTTPLGPAAVADDRFTVFISGRCVLEVEGPDAKRLAPRVVDAKAIETACAARARAPIPR